MKLTIAPKLSNRQKHHLNNLSESEQKAYLLSIAGFKIDDINTSIRGMKRYLVNEVYNHSLNTSKELSYDITRAGRFRALVNAQYSLGKNTPKDKNKYFGIEIECFIPRSNLNIDESCNEVDCHVCEGRGIVTYYCEANDDSHDSDCSNCDGSGRVESDDDSDDSTIDSIRNQISDLALKYKIKGLDVKTDGSLHSSDSDLIGLEFTLLVKQDDLSSLNHLCKMLNDLDASVNTSCGLHVHIDARGKTLPQIKRIGARFARALPFLQMIVPKSRKNNRYCLNSVSSLDGQRYHAVNLTAFKKYNTIEVRLHSATTSFEKIKNWIEVLSIIYSKKVSSPRQLKANSWSSFLEYINSPSLAEYLNERKQKFSPSDDTEYFDETDLNEPNEAAA